jgi:hypothetical protein
LGRATTIWSPFPNNEVANDKESRGCAAVDQDVIFGQPITLFRDQLTQVRIAKMVAITKWHLIQFHAEILQGAVTNRAFGQIESDAVPGKLLGASASIGRRRYFMFGSIRKIRFAPFENQSVKKFDRPASAILGGVRERDISKSQQQRLRTIDLLCSPARQHIVRTVSLRFFMALDLPQTSSKIGGPLVKQFSVFLPNKVGAMLDIVKLLSTRNAHVVALSISESTDSAIARIVVSDPEVVENIFREHDVAFGICEMVVVELQKSRRSWQNCSRPCSWQR